MENIDSTLNGQNKGDTLSTESTNSALINWRIEQLEKIDDFNKENFDSLIQKNFYLNLDYIIAITVNNKDEFVTRDGCEWARIILLNNLPDNLRENIKNTYYYYLNKDNPNSFCYLCSDQHLKSNSQKQYYFYLFANDPSLSAEQRNEHQLDLGNYYYNEKNEQKHLEKAFRWYRKAAQGGNAQACFNVGYFHETGQGGLKPNDEVAMVWYKLAAERTQDLIILLYVAQKLEQSRKDIHYIFSLYQKCASTENPLGIFSLIDYHERIGREADKQIAQNFRGMLSSHYQSCSASEIMQELYQQEIAKQTDLSN